MPTKTRNPKRSRLRLALPATSANLGPAFDAAALAMDFYIKLEARAAKEFSIIAHGRDREICGKLEDHLILNTYREVLQASGRKVNPLSVRIDNDIPIGKGCGSSAAARLAGIALAVHFGRLRWTDAQIVGEASRREHHPDNASACWMGGLTIARMSGEKDDITAAQVACVHPKRKWPLLLAVPDESLSTKEARLVLPAQYSRADAVINVQNSMLLLAAFTQGRPDLLASALEDRLHQPYRAALCPLLPCLQELKGKHGILGVVLSGAGPSVLMFLDPRNDARRNDDARTGVPRKDARRSNPKHDPLVALQKTLRLVADHLAQNHLRAELIPTSITLRGARSSMNRS
jgi:homoserine kinase